MLVRVAVALVDLDDRLDLRVVVAPVGPHAAGRRGVRGADAAQLLQVVVEHLGVVVVTSRARGRRSGAAAGCGPRAGRTSRCDARGGTATLRS